jgi:AraC family transcriptional regulator, transcriptional activator FtrA
MTMFVNILPMLPAAWRRVVAVAYDGLCTFEFGVVVEVFALPRPEIKVPWYTFRVCSADRGPLRATGGVTLRAEAGLGALRRAGTVVIPGWRDVDERPPEGLLREIRAAHARGARLASICSGVFVLAAAGILDGRRATTHWKYVERLQARYPQVRVEPDVLYVDEDRIVTSAGSAAGIDLCLHIVRRDYGAEIANQVARRLVVAPHREGGQSQYVPLAVGTGTGGGLARVLEWAQARLSEELSVARMGQRAVLTPRTFARRFREETGTTPHRWLIHQRLLAAQRRLETSRDSVDRIAEAVGFKTAATLQRHFRRTLRTTPTAYRRRFSKMSVKSAAR